jgi:hypothetical protein
LCEVQPVNIEQSTFRKAHRLLQVNMLQRGERVTTETWQGVTTKGRPDMETFELLNVDLTVPLHRIENLDHWRRDVQPNLPWADDHFLERIDGQPLNPGVQWAKWPWGNSADKFRAGGKFNHNYMERYWPRYANMTVDGTLAGPTFAPLHTQYMTPHKGIRGEYGDLNDVVALLRAQPHTRQAYLPIFFPEDTGVGDGGRKPCTLGYQFIVRKSGLYCYYPMRSCDLVRHFQDDVYMTIRLMLWILDQLRDTDNESEATFWHNVKPEELRMHMTSLHCFVNDMQVLKNSITS